jgi:hypothetical protein
VRSITADDLVRWHRGMTELRVTAEAALSSVDLEATMAPVDTGNPRTVFRAHLDADRLHEQLWVLPRGGRRRRRNDCSGRAARVSPAVRRLGSRRHEL